MNHVTSVARMPDFGTRSATLFLAPGMKQSVAAVLLGLLLLCSSLSAGEYPIGVEFDIDTVVRKGVRGDNWCQTWASDDNIYTMMDDGSGWWPGPSSGSMCIQIKGDHDFAARDVKSMPYNGRGFSGAAIR